MKLNLNNKKFINIYIIIKSMKKYLKKSGNNAKSIKHCRKSTYIYLLYDIESHRDYITACIGRRICHNWIMQNALPTIHSKCIFISKPRSLYTSVKFRNLRHF